MVGKIKEMKVLITGSKGMLGSDLIKVLSAHSAQTCRGRIHPTSSLDCEVIGIDLKDVDITKKDEIIKVISDIHPDLVIHTAAYTDVDGCERKKDLAFLINAHGTENICPAVKKLKVPLLYISTDHVFNGEKRSPYIESDIPEPLNIYGKSKLKGEEYVQSLVSDYFIIRTAGLFGKNRKNFVDTVLRKAREENVLKVVADQIHSPTYTMDLSKEIKRLIKTENYGIYHITNNGECSWYEFAQEILRLSRIKGVKLIPISSDELDLPAKRPKYSVLTNHHLSETIGDNMPSWQNALKKLGSGLNI